MEKSIMLLLIVFLLFTMEAIYEALHDQGLKIASAYIEFFYRIIVLTGLFAWFYQFKAPSLGEIQQESFVLFLIGCTLFRYMFFDQIYNLLRGNRLFYIRIVKWYDTAFRYFIKWSKLPPDHFLFTSKVILGLIGIKLMGYPKVALYILTILITGTISFFIWVFIKGIIKAWKNVQTKKK